MRWLGEMLKVTKGSDQRDPGGRGKRIEFPSGTQLPQLADLGRDKKTSSLAQKLAGLPPEHFEQVRAGASSVTKAGREPVPYQEARIRVVTVMASMGSSPGRIKPAHAREAVAITAHPRRSGRG